MLLHLIRDHGGLFLILVVASRTEDEDQQNGEPQNSGTLTLDDTSEFVRSINVAPAQARAKQEAIVVKIDTSHMREPSEGEEEEGEAIAEFEGASVKDELMDYDEEADAILQAIEQSMAHQGPVSAKEDERVEEVGAHGFRPANLNLTIPLLDWDLGRTDVQQGYGCDA